MIYAKFMPGRSLLHASRNRRELAVAKECGYDVVVISSDNYEEFVQTFPQYRLLSDGSVRVSYNMPKIERYWKILSGKISVLRASRKVDADFVSCHDLDSLWIFWLASRFKKHHPQLIYDSHEYELGRNKKRNFLQIWLVLHLERFLIKRCALSIMVNDVIADEVQRIHELKERPIVVRNIPNYWIIDKDICFAKRAELLSMMLSPRKMMLMYHGAVVGGRGIETILNLLSMNDHICLVVLGNAEHGYLERLKDIARKLQIDNRVLFHPSVSIGELWKYVGSADIGMITIPAVSKSYYYMLPNKFFENIQALTPVICSNYPAIQPIVEAYGIGLTCDPNDIADMNNCVERLSVDESFYATCVRNLKEAKEKLCWEKERLVLKNALLQLSNCKND